MKHKAVLFDLDGTLADTIRFWAEAYLQTLLEYGVPSMDYQMFWKDIYTQNLKLHDVLDMLSVPIEKEPEFRSTRDGHYTALLREKVEWLPKAKDTLEEVVDALPCGIVTGSFKIYVDAIDEKLNIRSLTPTFVTCDEFRKQGKPDPYCLYLGADKLNVDPKECMYIGDQVCDIEAANAAGMTSCLFKGPYTPDKIDGEADVVITELTEVLPLLSLSTPRKESTRTCSANLNL